MAGALEERLLRRVDGEVWLGAVLPDPDSLPRGERAETARQGEPAGADLLLVGGSSAGPGVFEAGMKAIRETATIPVVLFPGSYHQVVEGAEGILFTSLLSGRNPQYLVEEQVKGAPRALKAGIEPLPTAYLLIESGKATTVQIVWGTTPLDPSYQESVLAHALAAQFMGMRWVYLEAGSGAQRAGAPELVTLVEESTSLSVICGGGLRTPEDAGIRARAGARMIVTGNALEVRRDPEYLKAFASAIHAG